MARVKYVSDADRAAGGQAGLGGPPGEARGRVAAERRGYGEPLTFGHRADCLGFRHVQAGEKSAGPYCAPLRLTAEHFGNAHALDLPAGAQDDLRRCELIGRDLRLDPGPDDPHPVSALQRSKPLSAVDWPL